MRVTTPREWRHTETDGMESRRTDAQWLEDKRLTAALRNSSKETRGADVKPAYNAG
jgi:hypothetical protein